MYRHKKIFNYSSPLHFIGEHDKPHELMDENSPLFLGFRTGDWWKAFGKYELQDINEVMKIFNLKNSVNSKKSYGGTSFDNIKKMILKYKKKYD